MALALSYSSSHIHLVKTKTQTKTARKPKGAREVTPLEADLPRIESARDGDLLLFDGPRETIAASVPKTLAKTVRAMVGVRGFSKVVTEALAREVVRRNREELVALMEAESGRADPEFVARYRRLLSK